MVGMPIFVACSSRPALHGCHVLVAACVPYFLVCRSFSAAFPKEGSVGHYHLITYLLTPASDDAYVAGKLSTLQRAKNVHHKVDAALAVLEKAEQERYG